MIINCLKKKLNDNKLFERKLMKQRKGQQHNKHARHRMQICVENGNQRGGEPMRRSQFDSTTWQPYTYQR